VACAVAWEHGDRSRSGGASHASGDV